MPLLNFLPNIPDTLNVLTATGLILIAGVLGARLVTRLLPVPAITCYVLTGLLIGPSGLNLLNSTALNEISLLVDLALGLIIFELGRRLDYKWLLHEKWLLVTGVTLSLCLFVGLFELLSMMGVSPLVAWVAAAIGITTSPAVALNVVKEIKAEGQVSERLLNIVALGNSLAFIVAAMSLSALHLEYRAGWVAFIFHPLYLIAGSILLGWAVGKILIYFSYWLGRDIQGQRIVVFAVITATVGLSEMLKLSALIALLTFGITSRSHDRKYAVMEPDFGHLSSLLYVVFFVFSGAKLELVSLYTFWKLALLFIAARLGISVLLGTLSAPLNGLTLRKGALLGLGLLPMSGITILLAQSLIGFYPQFGMQLSAVMLPVLAILEILGPIGTRYALIASGEAKT